MYLIGKAVFEGAFGRPGEPSEFGMKQLDKLMAPDYRKWHENSVNETEKIKATMKYETLEIESDDGIKLRAMFFRAEGDSKKTAILIHGYQSTGFQDHSTNMQKYLEKGFNVLLPANRATGDSEGNYTGFGILESRDTLKWVDLIDKMIPDSQIVLQGVSLGGATVCMMSRLDISKSVKCIISDCAFKTVRAQLEEFCNIYHIPKFLIKGVVYWCNKKAKYHIDQDSPLEAVKEAKVPILFVHGGDDRFIPRRFCEELYDNCGSEKEKFYIEEAGHSSSYYFGKERYYNPIFEFIGKYVK
ncbi:MAG: alpha/beta hydrolase [Clostridia bacterium]|nr:alpha/beta hydrolase [Clostridia bacterium]